MVLEYRLFRGEAQARLLMEVGRTKYWGSLDKLLFEVYRFKETEVINTFLLLCVCRLVTERKGPAWCGSG